MQPSQNSRCPNCGYVYPGSYCPECGLERHAALAQVRAANRRAFKGVMLAHSASLLSLPYIMAVATNTSDKWRGVALMFIGFAYAIVFGVGLFTYGVMVWANVRSRMAFTLLNITIVTSWILYLFWMSQGELLSDLQREIRWAVEVLRKSL